MHAEMMLVTMLASLLMSLGGALVVGLLEMPPPPTAYQLRWCCIHAQPGAYPRSSAYLCRAARSRGVGR